jgi:DNA integrity scanning protein DisA with diadenylate cyclase activity
MKLGIWPFGNKSNENSVKEFVVIKNMPLEQVSCDILKEEIARRKKENHDRRVREANAKADKVDKLIDELCNEIMPVDGKNTSNSTYKETIIREYPSERNDNMETILDCINRTIDEVDHDAIHIASIFKYIKAECRKTLLANIKEEC